MQIYHKTCIQHWLKKSKTCPTCRAEARNAISLRWSFAPPPPSSASSSSDQRQESADLRELQRKNQGLKQRIQSLTAELEAAEKQQQKMEDLRKQLDASKQRETKAARDLVLERKMAKLAEMESEQLIKALQDRIHQLEESTRQNRTADMAAAYARRFLFADDASSTGASQEHSASITFANTVRQKNCDPYQIIQVQHDMIAKLNAKVRASVPLQPRPANRVQTKAEEEVGAHARRKPHAATAALQTQAENIKPQAPAQRADESDGASRSAIASGALSKIASFSAKRSFIRASNTGNAGLTDPHKRARQL